MPADKVMADNENTRAPAGGRELADVARHAYEARWVSQPDTVWQQVIDAVLASAAADERSAAVPPAHKLVPLEPTPQMLEAMKQSTWEGDRAMYRAAIAASPEVCASGSGDRETDK